VADTIASQDSSRAIRPAPAVHEDRPLLAVIQNAQDAEQLLVRGRRHTLHRHANEVHPVRFHELFFMGNRMLAGQAQVDDCLDAAFGQALYALIAWLAASKNVIVDDLEIGENFGSSAASAQVHGIAAATRSVAVRCIPFILPDGEI